MREIENCETYPRCTEAKVLTDDGTDASAFVFREVAQVEVCRTVRELESVPPHCDRLALTIRIDRVLLSILVGSESESNNGRVVARVGPVVVVELGAARDGGVKLGGTRRGCNDEGRSRVDNVTCTLRDGLLAVDSGRATGDLPVALDLLASAGANVVPGDLAADLLAVPASDRHLRFTIVVGQADGERVGLARRELVELCNATLACAA